MTGHKRPLNRTKVMQPATNGRLPSREVSELARKAGLLDKVDLSEDYFIPAQASLEDIDKFATLVAAAEREACAKFLERGVDLAGLSGNPAMQRFVCELLMGLATAIRARGNS